MAKTKLQLTSRRSEAIQAAFREHLADGLSTAPSDFEAAQGAISRLYERIGKKSPYFVRVDSPLAAELYIDLYCRVFPAAEKISRDQLWDQLRDQLWGQLRDQLGDQLWGQLRDQLWGQLRDQLRDQLWGQLGDQLRDQLRGQLRDQLGDQLWGQLRGQLGDQLGGQLRDQLWGQLRDQLWGQLGGQLRDQLGDQLWGQLRGQLWGQQIRYMGTWFWGAQDLGMWGWLDGGRRVGAVYPPALNEALDDHLAVCRSITWWYPFNEFCVLVNRPIIIARDSQNRLHSIDGPAVRYRDGYSLYAVHGVRLPDWIVDRPQEITAEAIEQEQNAEIRRVMVEQFGASRYLLESGSALIHRDATGLLYRKEQRDDEPIVMVRVLNSTPEPDGVMSRDEALAAFGEAAKAAMSAPEGARFKEYMIRVPQDMKTAHEAVAWTFGLRGEDYHPAIES